MGGVIDRIRTVGSSDSHLDIPCEKTRSAQFPWSKSQKDTSLTLSDHLEESLILTSPQGRALGSLIISSCKGMLRWLSRRQAGALHIFEAVFFLIGWVNEP